MPMSTAPGRRGVAVQAVRASSRETRKDDVAPTPWSRFHTATHISRLGTRALLSAARRASPVRRPCVAGARARGEERGTWRQSAVDYGQHGVSINAIAPGAIMTEMVKGSLIQIAGEAGWEDAGAQFVSVNPMRRFGEPNEVASLVAFLLPGGTIRQWRRRAYRRWAVAGILKALRPAAATSIEAADSYTPQETRCIECYSPSSASRSCRSRSS
jgi:Enoyl-(Acyl carrier protein) reductase